MQLLIVIRPSACFRRGRRNNARIFFSHPCGFGDGLRGARDRGRRRPACRRQSGANGDGFHKHGHGRQSRQRGTRRGGARGQSLFLDCDPALAAEIGRFLGAIAWAAPGFLGFAVLRGFLVAASHSRTVMITLILCIPMNAGLNWMLIFGHLGAPALGIAGSGCSTAVVQWLMFTGLGIYALAAPSLAKYRMRPFLRGWNEIGRILRLGLPIGGILGLEIGVFATTGILMGLLGADALGAHQLVMNCISVIFMVPLGIAQAATVRVAAALGSGAADTARRAGFVAIALGVAYMALMAVVLVAAPRAIARIYEI